jgi:hypothetical protein
MILSIVKSIVFHVSLVPPLIHSVRLTFQLYCNEISTYMNTFRCCTDYFWNCDCSGIFVIFLTSGKYIYHSFACNMEDD